MISKEYCKCPKCGSECEVDTSMILTSYPPKYQAFCKNCNEVVYIFCSDVYGKASINPENNTIKKDVDYHNDIHRIADALEKLAKYFTEDTKIEVKEMTDEEKEKLLKEYRKRYLDLTTAPFPSPSITLSNMCEDCWYYQQRKYSNKIEFGDSPCTWCPKMQVTCTSNLSSEIKCSGDK